MKKLSLLVLVLALLIPNFTYGTGYESDIKYETEKAEVLEVSDPVETGIEAEGDFFEYSQNLRVKILSGPRKGEIVNIVNTLGDSLAYNIYVDRGDKITVSIETSGGQETVQLLDYYRLDGIRFLILGFMALVILVGGWQGVRSLVSLALTILAIVYILLPGMLKGHSPILLSTLVSVGVTIATILIITGFTRKSLVAIVGTSLGVILAALTAFVTSKATRLTGLSADDVTMLLYIPQGIDFNLQDLLFSGIILGSLGAVMDVGMSIASSIEEIYGNNKSLTRKELFKSGMNVGRDIMGTMVNTLILAYTGASIPILLLFLAYDSTILEVMNLDMIATEIVRSVSGSIGLILTIPISSLVASFLIDRFRRDKSEG